MLSLYLRNSFEVISSYIYTIPKPNHLFYRLDYLLYITPAITIFFFYKTRSLIIII